MTTRGRRRGNGDGGLNDLVDRASETIDENLFEPLFRSQHSSNAELLQRIVMTDRELKVVGKLKRIKVAAFAGFAFFGLYAFSALGAGRVLHAGVCCALAHDCLVVSYNAYHKKYLIAVANQLGGDLVAIGKTLLDVIAGKSLDAVKEEVVVSLLVSNTISKTLLHKFGKFLNK